MQKRNFSFTLLTLTCLLLSTDDAAALDRESVVGISTFMAVFGAGIISVVELFRRALTSTKGVLVITITYTSALLFALELAIWTEGVMRR